MLAFFQRKEYNKITRVAKTREVPPNGTLSVDERGDPAVYLARPLINPKG